jgi:hypothetical protein
MTERTQVWERELTSVLEPVAAPASLWFRVEAALDRPAPRRRWAPRLAFALSLVVLAASAAFYRFREPSLAATALETHRQFRLHPERLDILQNEPTALRDWIASRTALTVALADRPAPDPDGFVLSGARLLHGGRVAVFYRIGGYPATLLIARDTVAAVGAGKQIARRTQPDQATTLFTWQTHGQAYALVSSIPEAGQRACFACHVDAERRQGILKMKWNG